MLCVHVFCASARVCVCVYEFVCEHVRERKTERLSPGPCRVMTQGGSGRTPCRFDQLPPAASASGLVLLAGFEGNLQHAIAQAVAI